jgi:paraquat-inducible protein A
LSAPVTARALGLVSCHVCGLVCRATEPELADRGCPRCHAPLHRRKPNSIGRSWAYLLAAAIAYIPANLLPIMLTNTLFERRQDTILSGVLELWNSGSWDLALIVFVASIVVPMFKIAVLIMLLLTTQRRSRWRREERTRLYRFIETIGHWSMLDVFVVALLVALVRFQNMAAVLPGPGAVAFGAVVILTMLASSSFDPRLIWDDPEAVPAARSEPLPHGDAPLTER